eukprot:4076826-Prymnesium_polylepis.2
MQMFEPAQHTVEQGDALPCREPRRLRVVQPALQRAACHERHGDAWHGPPEHERHQLEQISVFTPHLPHDLDFIVQLHHLLVLGTHLDGWQPIEHLDRKLTATQLLAAAYLHALPLVQNFDVVDGARRADADFLAPL